MHCDLKCSWQIIIIPTNLYATRLSIETRYYVLFRLFSIFVSLLHDILDAGEFNHVSILIIAEFDLINLSFALIRGSFTPGRIRNNHIPSHYLPNCMHLSQTSDYLLKLLKIDIYFRTVFQSLRQSNQIKIELCNFVVENVLLRRSLFCSHSWFISNL